MQDTGTGLAYADQRYYDQSWGRFLTPDPSNANVSLVDPGSWNHYSFANGDPVNGSDPTGLDVNCGPGMAWDGEGCTVAGSGLTNSGPAPVSLSADGSLSQSMQDAYNNYVAGQDAMFQNNYLDWYYDPTRLLLQQADQIGDIETLLRDRLSQAGVSADQIGDVIDLLEGGNTVGGHFNLNLDMSSLETAIGVDAASNVLSVLTTDYPTPLGIGGNRGGADNLFDSLHSEYLGNPQDGVLTFHIDTFNAFAYPPVGAILHAIVDVGFGHLIQPGCIDPACP